MISYRFKEWACSLSGCDGGNIDAETWFCGIEWGGGSDEKDKYYEEFLINEISKGKAKIEENIYSWNHHNNYTYGRSLAKLYAAITGQKVENYIELTNQWKGKEIFRLNLYPIAFASTKPTLWHNYGLDKITGFDEKNLFQTWCFMNRFPFIAELRKKHKPKLIVCTGITYLLDFFVCFGGNQKNSSLIKQDDIIPISPGNKNYPRRYYWVQLDEYSTLIVTPFFSGRYGLNSNYLLQEMGNRIRKICDIVHN